MLVARRVAAAALAVAVIGVGAVATSPAQAATKKASKVTFAVARTVNPTVVGNKVKFSGAIAEKKSGRKIAVQVYDNQTGWLAKWKTVATLKTASNGKFSGSAKANIWGTTVKYRAVFAGDTKFKSSTSTKTLSNVYRWFDASYIFTTGNDGGAMDYVTLNGMNYTQNFAVYGYQGTSSMSFPIRNCIKFTGLIGLDSEVSHGEAGAQVTLKGSSSTLFDQHLVVGTNIAGTPVNASIAGQSSLTFSQTYNDEGPDGGYVQADLVNPRVLCSTTPTGYTSLLINK